MSLTALEIQQQSFGTSRHGYDPQEVDVFLERIATEVENFTRALVDAKARIDAAEARAQAAEHQAAVSAQNAQAASEVSYAQSPKVSAEAAATEQQIAKAFIAAQKSADEMREQSRQESEKAYREAEARARDIVRDALAEKQRILDEVDRLRESAEKFRTDYLSLLNHFSADAKKNLPGIDSIVPDTSADKRATADAAKILRENDVASAAPEVAAAPVQTYTPAPAVTVAEPEPEPASEPQITFAQPTTAYEPLADDDFDDDLDIEEID